MAFSSFLPDIPSTSRRKIQRKKLSLRRVGSSNGSFRKEYNPRQRNEQDSQQKERLKKKKKSKSKKKMKNEQASSWDQLKSLFASRFVGLGQIIDPSLAAASLKTAKNSYRYLKLNSSCSKACKFEDVIHGKNRPVIPRRRGPDSLAATSSKGRLHLRRFPSCYECHAIAEPRRYPPPRVSFSCPECSDVFAHSENLDVHRTIRHAVSELAPEDSGRNIVEIIFKSSWLKRDATLCHIERILKVHNSEKTVTRFEDYRSSIKARAAAGHGGVGKRHARCAADGNELLRFHCCGILCDLGAHGGASLCSSSSLSSVSPCGVCTIIRHGFGRARHEPGKGVRTTASSGHAHGYEAQGGPETRAMLVCRVIAGRVKRAGDEAVVTVGFDSITTDHHAFAGVGGGFASVEELFTANPRAILPCFVVVYRVTAA